MALSEDKDKNKKEYKPSGIDILDQMSPQQRRELKARLQAHFNSLSPQERAEHLELTYDLIRQKMHQHHGMISEADALREYLNQDFPRLIEAGAQDMEAEAQRTGNIGYLRIAESLRRTKWGTEVFDFTVHKVERDEDVGVGSYNEARDKEE